MESSGAREDRQIDFHRLTEEDKERFDVHTTIQALKIPKQQSGRCMKTLQGLLYQRPGVKRIEQCGEEGKRLVLLREGLTGDLDDASDPATRPEVVGEDGAVRTLAEYVRENDFEVLPYVITLGYKHMSL